MADSTDSPLQVTSFFVEDDLASASAAADLQQHLLAQHGIHSHSVVPAGWVGHQKLLYTVARQGDDVVACARGFLHSDELRWPLQTVDLPRFVHAQLNTAESAEIGGLASTASPDVTAWFLRRHVQALRRQGAWRLFATAGQHTISLAHRIGFQVMMPHICVRPFPPSCLLALRAPQWN